MMTIALKPQKYLVAAHVGALTLIAAFAAAALGAPDFVKGLPIGMLLVFVGVLFVRRFRDEYIERLWNAGTEAAFITALVSTLGVELVRGFANMTPDVWSGPFLFTPVTIGALTLAAFFAGFHIAWWRTRA